MGMLNYQEGGTPVAGLWTHVEAQVVAYLMCNQLSGEYVLYLNRLPCMNCHRFTQRMLPVGTKLTLVYSYDNSNTIVLHYERKSGCRSGQYIPYSPSYRPPWFIPNNHNKKDTEWDQDIKWGGYSDPSTWHHWSKDGTVWHV